MEVKKRIQILRVLEMMERNNRYAEKLGLKDKSTFDYEKIKTMQNVIRREMVNL